MGSKTLRLFVICITTLNLQFSTSNAFAQSIYPPAPVKQVKVALILVDPFVPGQPGVRFHTHFTGTDPWGETWTAPQILADKLLDSMNAVSHGVVNYSFAYTFDDTTMSYTRMQGNILSVDSLFKLYSEPGWPTLLANSTQCDYQMLLNQYNLCYKRDSNLIHEVWVYGPPYLGAYESCMAGTNAFWINGPVITGTSCSDLLSVMGFNLARNFDLAMHSYCHRFENVMLHRYGRWDYAAPNPNNWERFSSYDKVWPDSGHVGNCHFPPNALNDYEYSKTDSVYSFADVWKNYPNLTGNKRKVNCQEWHCAIHDELTYFSWWYRHIPYFDCVNPGDQKLNNWWHYVVDYNEAIARENNFNINPLNCLATDIHTQDKTSSTFDIFPNPSSGKFSIEWNSGQRTIGELEIYNVMGEKVYPHPIAIGTIPLTINLSDWPNGVYFLQIKTDQKSEVKKIIISH